MKKTLSLFLSIAMLISMLSGLNLTAYAAVDTGSCGDSVRWSYNKSTNELMIIGTGEMYDYSYASSDYNETPWDSYRDSIQKVTIKNGVTNIGSDAFYKCASLKSVTIPDSVTSIGGDAFWHCTSLTSVTIPDGVISISDDTFCGCKSLTSVTIPDSVTSIGGGAFCYCTSLTDIAIPDSVTYIGTGAFIGTGMYYDSANWDGDVFYIGKYLLSARDTISGDYDVKDGTVLIAYGAFYNCVSLESVTIPDSVKYMCEWAFCECQSLENVTIGDGLISIGDYAFCNCVSLTDVTLPDNIINLSEDSFSTTKMYDDPANWDDGVFYVGKHIAGVNIYEAEKFKIREGVFYIPANAFYSCDFEEVIIPDGVISIGDNAFENCYELKSVIISDSVTSIGDNAFKECDELKSVIISDSVTSIGDNAFYWCYRLKDIYYTGSESEWNEISIGDEAISDDVTIHYNYHEHVNSFNYESEPTCTEEGMKHYTCDICGLEYTVVTSPALGHAFGNNNKTCSVCGEANPNYVEPSDNTPNNTPTNPSNNQNNQNNQPSAQAPAAQPSQDTTTKPAENNEKPQEVYLGKIPSGVAVKSQKKAIKVSWKKVKSAKGYQVQLATNSKFTKGQKTYSVKGANATSKIIKGLKSGKKYYLRVRSYKTVKGKTVYSKWSKAKSIKVK